MRADRLVAALLILQARGRITATDLARELEISPRTARRDLEALAMAGVPVYSQAGRGGGWSLVGGARTDLSGLTAAEVRTLFLVAGPSSSATPDVKAALRKLVRALPETFRAGAEAAAAAVVFDPSGWDHTPLPPPAHLEILQRAVVDGVQIRLGYSGRDRRESERTVHPLGLVAKGPVWYLVAGTADGMRTFRVNRVRSVTLTTEAVERPPDFNLTETWRSTAADINERRAPLRVEARAEQGVVGWLRGRFGNRLVVNGTGPDGWVEVTIRAHSPASVAADLAGFGAGVEVLGPSEVSEELVRLGTEILDRYLPSRARIQPLIMDANSSGL